MPTAAPHPAINIATKTSEVHPRESGELNFRRDIFLPICAVIRSDAGIGPKDALPAWNGVGKEFGETVAEVVARPCPERSSERVL